MGQCVNCFLFQDIYLSWLLLQSSRHISVKRKDFKVSDCHYALQVCDIVLIGLVPPPGIMIDRELRDRICGTVGKCRTQTSEG